MFFNSARSKKYRGYLALVALSIVAGLFVTLVSTRRGCACGGALLEDAPAQFTEDEVRALVGRRVVTNSDTRIGVYNPYASLVLSERTPGQIVTFKEVVFSDTGERKFQVTVAYQVRAGRIDTWDYDKERFLELFTAEPAPTSPQTARPLPPAAGLAE